MYCASLSRLVIHQDSHAQRVGRDGPFPPSARPLSRRGVSAPRTALLLGHQEQGRDQNRSDLAGLFKNLSGLRAPFRAFSKLLSHCLNRKAHIYIKQRRLKVRLPSDKSISPRQCKSFKEEHTTTTIPKVCSPSDSPSAHILSEQGAPARRQAGIGSQKTTLPSRPSCCSPKCLVYFHRSSSSHSLPPSLPLPPFPPPFSSSQLVIAVLFYSNLYFYFLFSQGNLPRGLTNA